MAAARRTSPGLMPTALALARSTSISIVGSAGGEATLALETPFRPAMRVPHLAGLLVQDVQVGAEQPDGDLVLRLASRSLIRSLE